MKLANNTRFSGVGLKKLLRAGLVLVWVWLGIVMLSVITGCTSQSVGRTVPDHF